MEYTLNAMKQNHLGRANPYVREKVTVGTMVSFIHFKMFVRNDVLKMT